MINLPQCKIMSSGYIFLFSTSSQGLSAMTPPIPLYCTSVLVCLCFVYDTEAP